MSVAGWLRGLLPPHVHTQDEQARRFLTGMRRLAEMRAGASSAKGRLEENGYSNVGKLTKDDNGVWKGPATHAGSQVTVSVDYRGNITRN